MVEEDRISQLPDPLICDILSHLPTKDSVRTSSLSTRWRNLWSLVPSLDLDSRTFSDLDAFVSFADKFFDKQTESSVHKLRLLIEKPQEGKAFLLPWVDAVTTRKIQHFDIGILGSSLKFEEIPLLPLSVYTCETLVHLELHQLVLVGSECFSLPCLKVLRLFYIRYHNVAALEKLISGSPVLEDIWMMTPYSFETNVESSDDETNVESSDDETNFESSDDETKVTSSDETKVLQVRSQSLKRIAIDHQNTQVVIDAPQLERLRTRLDKTKNYEIISLGFPAKVDIHFGSMSDTLVVDDILTEISGVSDLVISSFDWERTFTNSVPLFQFDYLSRLKATFSASDLKLLPNLLESCPILESLILELYDEPMSMISTVPPCLVSSLKFVKLISYVYEFKEGDLNLIRYFLKNSTILEKLSLRFPRITASHDVLKEQVVAMPRCSSTCQVYVL